MPTKATLATPAPAAGKFRPASLADFNRYAKNLAALTLLGLQKAQNLLARIYGYANLHELHTALKGVGAAPGPFEDEEEPMRFLPGWVSDTYGEHLRRVLALTGATIRADSPETPLYRVKLVGLLGLFSSPEMHRRCVAMVQSHLRLIEKLGLDPTLVEPLTGYRHPWTFSEGALAGFELVRKTQDESRPQAFAPQAQLDSLYQFHLARLVLEHTPTGGKHPLTREFVLEESADMDHTLRILDASYKEMVVGNGAYSLLYSVFPDALDQEDGDFDAMEQKFAFEELCAFIETPNSRLPETHPVLQRVENPWDYAKDLLNEFHVQEARRYLGRQDNTQAVLYTTRALPEHVDLGTEEGHLELYVHLKRAAMGSPGGSNVVFWEFCATAGVVDVKKRTSRPVALMEGTLIAPLRGRGKLDESADGYDFETALSEHSEILRDVAEPLRDYYFEPSVHEERTGKGLLYASIELAPGTSPEKLYFLRMLLTTLNNLPFTHWRAPFPDATETAEFGPDAVYGGLSLPETAALLLEDAEVTEEQAATLEEQTGVEVLFYNSMLVYGVPRLRQAE